ncbi:MAG: O-antigen ligase family protein, partial [Vicinamibacterales bacterium]
MTTAAAPAPGASPVLHVAVGLARALAAAVLLGALAVGAAAPEVPLLLKLACGAALAATLAHPVAGLLTVAALAPAGLLLAPAPASASEALAWSFLAGWLLALWRPLGATRGAPPRREPAVAGAPGSVPLRAIGLYAAAIGVSWLGLVLADAGGIPVPQLPGYLLRAVSPDYLVFSSPEPETWSAIRALTGLALVAASLTLTSREPRLARWVALTLVAGSAVLGVATLGGVWSAWATEGGYGGWFLWRYVTGVRYSLHLTDLNAAGSLFVLAGLTAAALAAGGVRRGAATAAGVLMLPALLLSGSRSAVAGAVAAGALVLLRGPGRPAAAGQASRLLLSAAAVVAVLLGGVVVTSTLTSDPTGGAGASLGMRTEFAATSVRMLASAPVFGVGIGRYYPRSPEFMSAHLRSIYPYENAHNYLLQQFAELGVVGGGLFVLMLAVLLAGIWRSLRARPSPEVLALVAGVAAYLATCLTGHPLLVPEAAFPFWIALGAAAGASAAAVPMPAWGVWVPRGVATLLAASLIVSAARANRVFPQPPDRGFHDEQRTDAGVKYRWTTRHAVAWVQPDVGFLTIDVQAPALPGRARPFVVTLEADGVLVQTATVPPDRWTQVGVALPTRSATARRRIDLRVNQVWTEKRDRPGP